MGCCWIRKKNKTDIQKNLEKSLGEVGYDSSPVHLFRIYMV